MSGISRTNCAIGGINQNAPGAVAGAVDNDSPETLLAFPAESVAASAPPAVSGNKFPLEESKLFLQLL